MIMMPVRRTQNWLPSIFNDFFDNDWMGWYAESWL